MIRLLAVIFLAVMALPATAQTCDLVHPPRGLIDAEYTRLQRHLGPLRCPLASEELFLDQQGAYQEFERGQIVWSPQSGDANAVLAAYYRPKCSTAADRPCIVFRWRNLPSSDVFIIRVADEEHADLADTLGLAGQLDVIV